jgi:hypothetical protein
MITLNDIGVAIRERLRDSAPILAQSQALFSKPHKVFYGTGGPKSPEIDDSPEYVLIPLTKENPQAASRHYEFLLGCAFKDATDTIVTTDAGVYMEVIEGFEKLEAMVDLAWAEVLKVSSSLEWNKGSLEISPLEVFPSFAGRMTIQATVPYTIGGDPVL